MEHSNVVINKKDIKEYSLKFEGMYVNKTRIIIDMVDRFIIRGRNSDYDIDALVCGTINDYVWINKYDLYDLILSKRCLDYTSPHIACLTIGPKKRNVDKNSRYKDEKFIVCIRWNFIKESILDFKNGKYSDQYALLHEKTSNLIDVIF